MNQHNLSISSLQSHLGYWLRYVSNHVSNQFRHKLRDQQVTVAEWVILRELYDVQPTAAKNLALHLNLTKGAISKLLKRLEIKQLVEISNEPADGRQSVIQLSNLGKQLLPSLAILADQNDAEFFACLTQQEKQLLLGLMQKIVIHNKLQAIPLD